MWEVIKDTVLHDTLPIIPILFCVYLLISYFSHNSNKYLKFMERTKKLGPLVGATTGVLPQCGFSVVMSDLYTKQKITLGTLIAVFVATSDEAIPLMIADYTQIPTLLILLAIKFVYAIICGYAIDLIFKSIKNNKEKLALQTDVVTFPESIKNRKCEVCHHQDCSCEECEHNHNCECEEGAQHSHEHSHIHKHCCADNIFVDALIHTLEITAFVLVASLAINLLVYYLGTDALTSIFTSNKYIQTLVASVIGLIPNCVASVLLVDLFTAGAISFGALLAGLTTGAGVGLLVLFKNNPKKWKQSLGILLLMYAFGVLLGMVTNLIV